MILFRYQKIRKVTEVLGDLVRINNDRIATYELALTQVHLGPDLQHEFHSIVTGGKRFKEQLTAKIDELNGEAGKGVTLFGRVYTLWIDLKVALALNSQKAVINACLYNEEIALHAYSAALNMNAASAHDVRTLIESQLQSLKDIHTTLKKYKEMRHFVGHGLLYFN